MSAIEFYYMPESPPCRTVEMVAELVGVKLNKHYINLATKDNLKEDYVQLNPRHKVPFIIDGDVRITESRAIARYLVNKYKPDDEYLYPKDPVKRAYVDESLDFELGALYPAQYKLLAPMIYGPAKLNADDEKSYKDVLHYLDEKLAHNGAKKFLVGDHPSIADISLVAALSFPYACDYDIDDYQQIKAYIQRARAAIPRYSEINDEPIENMRKFIQSKQQQQQ